MSIKQRLTRENARQLAHAANPGWTRHQWIIGAAWFFVMFSLVRLIGVIAATTADPSQTVSIIGGDEFSAPLLTYAGGLGAIWAWLQTMIIAGAAIFTLTPVRKFRRIDHGILLGWAGFWTLSFFALTAIEGGFAPIAQSVAMTGLLGCVGYRAWTTRKGSEMNVALQEHVIIIDPEDAETVDIEPPNALVARIGAVGKTIARAARTTSQAVRTFAHNNWKRLRDGHDTSAPQQPSNPITATASHIA